MRRLATFPVLFLAAVGCLVAAVEIGQPDQYECQEPTNATARALLVLSGTLAFGSVVLPWFRYVRSDGGRARPFEILVGVGGGLIVAGLFALIGFALIAHTNACD